MLSGAKIVPSHFTAQVWLNDKMWGEMGVECWHDYQSEAPPLVGVRGGERTFLALKIPIWDKRCGLIWHQIASHVPYWNNFTRGAGDTPFLNDYQYLQENTLFSAQKVLFCSWLGLPGKMCRPLPQDRNTSKLVWKCKWACCIHLLNVIS